MGRRAHIPAEKIDAVVNYRDSEVLSTLEKQVIEFAECLTRTPSDVPDDLYNALAGQFSRAQIVELTEVIATENHRARFNRAFDIGSQDYCEVRPKRGAS